MKFLPSFHRCRSPDGGAGVVAAMADAIGLVALVESSTVSPSLLPASCGVSAGAGAVSATAGAGASATAASFSAGGVSLPQAAQASMAASIQILKLFIAIPVYMTRAHAFLRRSTGRQ